MTRTSGTSDASCARACARTDHPAHVPWDSELPPELWLIVLRHMTLMQLRLLKTVSRSMANRCRRVLRSKEWQDWCANDFAMEQEVATQATRNYTLPMTVRFLEDYLVSPPLYGTIHRLKLKLVHRTKPDERPIDSLVPTNWSFSCLEERGTINIRVVDMLIEVHGYGLCGCDYALRRLLADVVLEKTRFTQNEGMQNHLARELCDTRITQIMEEDGTPAWGDVENNGTEMPLWQLLQQICPVTNIGGGWGNDSGWATHRVTHQQQFGRDQPTIDLLHLCANCPGLLTGS